MDYKFRLPFRFFKSKWYRKELYRSFSNYDEIFKSTKDLGTYLGAIVIIIGIFFAFLDRYKSFSIFVAAIFAILIRLIRIDSVIYKLNTSTEKHNSKIYPRTGNGFEVVFDKPLRCLPTIMIKSPLDQRLVISSVKETGFVVEFLGVNTTVAVSEFKFFAGTMP
jgi:hypothetical protein